MDKIKRLDYNKIIKIILFLIWFFSLIMILFQDDLIGILKYGLVTFLISFDFIFVKNL